MLNRKVCNNTKPQEVENNISILSAIGQIFWSKVPAAGPKTARLSSCELFSTIRLFHSIKDDLGKSKNFTT